MAELLRSVKVEVGLADGKVAFLEFGFEPNTLWTIFSSDDGIGFWIECSKSALLAIKEQIDLALDNLELLEEEVVRGGIGR